MTFRVEMLDFNDNALWIGTALILLVSANAAWPSLFRRPRWREREDVLPFTVAAMVLLTLAVTAYILQIAP